jgi:Family of unknown function (DUF5689)/Domain of unknown function (DUF5017)
MKPFTKTNPSVLCMMMFVLTITSCIKNFDAPPGPGEVNIVANTSINALKTYHTIPGTYDEITEDVIISGVITANDKSGNFYKQLFIQDTSGAMQILVDAYSLYASYPVGRKVYVKCKGLTLSDSYGNMVLGIKAIINGSPSMEGIPAAMVTKHLIGSTLNNPVEPLTITASDLGTTMNNRYINALVKLENYEFVTGDTGKIYSDTSSYKSTTNRLISTGCGSTLTLTVRTSGYANFAGVKLPSGNGSLTAIYTIYKSSPTSATTTKQMIIREPGDVQFDNSRCGAPPVGTIVLLNEDFETQTANTTFPYVPVTIAGWNNISEIGTRTFDARIFSNNKYAYMSAFGTNAGAVKTWLVTKGINLDNTTSETLNFETKQDFYMSSTNGSGFPVPSDLKILISTNYTGTGNPWAAGVNWTDITSSATLSPGSTTSNYPSSYTPSGTIDLSTYSGTVYIAFRYEGTDAASTTTVAGDKTSAWEIDNIRVWGR